MNDRTKGITHANLGYRGHGIYCLDRFMGMFAGNGENLVAFGCPLGTQTDELGKDGRDLQQKARQVIDLFMAWLEAQFDRVMPSVQARKHAEHLMVQA